MPFLPPFLLQVPLLVVFSVLTLAPQTAVCYYLMLGAQLRGPVDIAVQIPIAILLACQFLAGIYAVSG